VHGERPDHEDRHRDERNRPHRVPRLPCKHNQRPQHRNDNTNRTRPHVCGEQTEARNQDDDPENQMDSTPRRCIELEDVLLTDHEERVIRDRHDA
jgi:hypothetical protein